MEIFIADKFSKFIVDGNCGAFGIAFLICFFKNENETRKYMKNTEIKLFENKKVRSLWDAEQEKWYISIVDVVEVLTESPNPRKYWSVLKTRLKQEGSELATNCSQLKMQSSDGKFYKTDVADVEQLFRLVQSI